VIIQEFYDSGEIDEAIRCLRELHVPHFHHEFIYEALDFILQKGDDYAIDLITNLFKRLYDSVTVTYDQLKMVWLGLFTYHDFICFCFNIL
jgi:programmed cell death protein 4